MKVSLNDRRHFCRSMLFILFACVAIAGTEARVSSRPSLARGKYIVDHVAMCVQCHTPRNESGDLLADRYLEGAPVPVPAPPYPTIDWALKAPAIAGLIGYTEEEGIRLLTKGVTRDGRVPNPPMPAFRLTPEDAKAVVEYLQSLK